ncbi:MAG TPA: nuclear transport factor 2 family protein [Acidimicrobiales bacterium]|jgi:hypothetical protein
MLSLQELSDRAEIQDLMAAYSAAVDGQEWDRFDDIFVEDAELDFTDVADFQAHDRETFKQWLAGGLPQGRHYFHLCATTHATIDGDKAEAITLCLNPMPADDRVLLFGHWYRDALVRTPAGWRIARRRLELCFHAPLAPFPGVSPWVSPWGATST